MSYCYKYPRPAITVDCVIVSQEASLRVLLIKRVNDPYKDHWALPGGFVDMDEELDAAAKRELEEETGLKISNLSQLYVFDKVDRDPRGRTISVAFTGKVDHEKEKLTSGSDAKEVKWFNINSLPSLAFDHKEIIEKALHQLNLKTN